MKPFLPSLLLASSGLLLILSAPSHGAAFEDGAPTRAVFGAVADPALLLPGHPGVPSPSTPDTCRARRQALATQIENGVFLAQAGEEGKGRFDPDVDFHYLTGLKRADAKLLLVVKDGRLERDALYLPQQSASQKLWEGPKLNPEDLGDDSFFGEVHDLETFDFEALAKLAGEEGILAVDDTTIDELVEYDIEVKRARNALNALQKVKTPAEQAAIETAVQITLASIADAIVVARPGSWEFVAEAAIEGGFRRRGAEFLAFPSICGSGPNSCFLHYRANNRRLEAGELLLMDVGAKYQGYSADVTRTIPISGKFSERQREIYDLVWQAQQLAVADLRPGVTMRDLHNKVVAFFDEKGYRGYFKHGLGHQLGVRVHDVPGFRGTLEAGMVVTIEPGLYIAEENLGVRIEDDYLVTEEGSRKLSAAIPSAPDELEAYIARLRGTRAP